MAPQTEKIASAAPPVAAAVASRFQAADPVLHATPDNPVPGQAIVSHVRTADGLTLRVARWRPTGRQAKGTVLIANGRAEFIEKYFETIRDLRRRGFHVVAFDWRGQGGSQRLTRNPRKGHVTSFERYLRDLDAVMGQAMLPFAPAPYFALGHSTGAAVLLMAAHDLKLPFKRMVLLSPLIDLVRSQGKRWPYLAAFGLRALGFGASFVPGGGETSLMTRPFAGNVLTSDPARYARTSTIASTFPQIAIGEPTIAWVAAALSTIRRFARPRYPLELKIPILMIAGTQDELCASPAAERFAARMKGGGGLMIKGGRHELLMERDIIREQVFAAFDAFVPGSDAVPAEPDGAEAGIEAETLPSPARKQRKRRRVKPAVTGGDDGAALGG